ncbi:MAG: formate dehydrogenase accessory protein FdhE [Syntrophales bacterium]|jgi:FdhE protein|nr:formate dehydrogenase accessory protein FdhE [Syntrophales bacterium]MCK9527071.1 formate dehydrogenase accessory protein FdhE [Syntrophales bacterium]MDX9921804.1 formate dehydrogenase accessory protein FdhE [Syntrophales bacterium]
MGKHTAEAAAIDAVVDHAIEQNPHSSSLLEAFRPVIRQQRFLVESLPLPKLDYSTIDKDRMKSGVPVTRQINLLSTDDPVKEATLCIAPAVSQGFPSLTEGIETFTYLVEGGVIDPADYFRTNTNDTTNSAAAAWEQEHALDQELSLFLMNLVSRIILEKRAGEIEADMDRLPWEKGYCPICGAFPSIALIEEEGGRRFLHCSSCGHDWSFTRVACPYCEHRTPQGMHYFFIEGAPQESAFICERCNKYLVTLHRVGNILDRDMEVSAISLAHLDILMRRKGYEPMSCCPWNTID